MGVSVETIKTFLSVFSGRKDIVPKHWISKKTGNTGYSPLCRNEWENNLCARKHGGSCHSCKNQDLIPISQDLMRRHFSGNKIFGVYPLLPDETCNFLAGDFDKHKPTDPEPLEEVKAYVEVCEVQDLPVYVLRSKSGKGYHVYIFSKTPVPAWKARTVGFALLKEAGVIDDDTDKKKAFDRLFPNQVKLNGKGFGNLIALPWQGTAAKEGHTLFLDPETGFAEPYKNQVQILENVKKVSEADLDRIITEWGLHREQAESPKGQSPIGERNFDDNDFPPATLGKIKVGCKFIKHCEADAATLSEPEWYAMLSITARCKNGTKLSHRLSEPHPQYSPDETAAKIEHALRDTGPLTCAKIKKLSPDSCGKCQHYGKIKSPIVLGWFEASEAIYEDIVAEMNKTHGIVMIGGKCVVMNKTIDPVFNRPDITFSSRGDLYNYYANRLVAHPEKPNKMVSIADVWWSHPNPKAISRSCF